MPRIVTGTKTIPVTGDTLIIKDSEAGNALREIDFDDLRIFSVDQTGVDAGNVRTYTIWLNSERTHSGGTFTLQDGADGSGSSIPDYSALIGYDQGQVARTSNGSIVRSVNNLNLNNTPPTLEDDVFWVFVVNTVKARVISDAELIQDGREYYVDTSGGSVTLTMDDTVNHLTVRDHNGSWSNAAPLVVDITSTGTGVDTITFGQASRDTYYKFVRSGATFRVYGDDGTLTIGNIT